MRANDISGKDTPILTDSIGRIITCSEAPTTENGIPFVDAQLQFDDDGNLLIKINDSIFPRDEDGNLLVTLSNVNLITDENGNLKVVLAGLDLITDEDGNLKVKVSDAELSTDISGNLKVALPNVDGSGNLKVSVINPGLRTDGDGNVIVSLSSSFLGVNPIIDVRSTTLFRNVKSSAGTLLSFVASNGSSNALFVQIYNGTNTNGTPIEEIPISAGTTTQPSFLSTDISDYGSKGLYCSGGITWAFSTTSGSYVAPGSAANLHITVKYI